MENTNTNQNFESEFGIDSDRDYRNGLNNAARPVPDFDRAVEAPADLPLHPEQAAPEPNDAGAARSELHPVDYPVVPLSTDTNAVRELGDFAKFVAAMREKDYGDWMRRANVYWAALRDNLLRNANAGEVKHIEMELARLKEEIQYRPNWKIAETQRTVVTKALELRRRFGGGETMDIHDLELSTATETPPESVH